MTHGLDGRAVGGVLVAAAGPLCGGDGSRLGDAHEFEGEVAVGMLRGLEGHGCPRVLVRGAAMREPTPGAPDSEPRLALVRRPEPASADGRRGLAMIGRHACPVQSAGWPTRSRVR